MEFNVEEKVRNQISSERATTIRHKAGLSGELMGEPRTCSITLVPIENWVMRRELRIMSSMSLNDNLPSDGATGSALHDVSGRVAFPIGFTDRISSGCVLIAVVRNCNKRCQLAMKRSVSTLVKKPARSWL